MKYVPDLARCLDQCKQSYGNPAEDPTKPFRLRYVEPFRFEGGILAFVDQPEDENVAYVIFRGTDEFGNWLLTNGQAYMTNPQPTIKVAAGKVHQGFLRAFSLLWHGEDIRERRRAGRAKYLFGPAIATEIVLLFYVLPWLLVGRYSHPWPVPHWLWTWCLLLSLMVVLHFLIGSGWLERLVSRGKRLELGPELSKVLNLLHKEHVVFVGHSLGGAMATLAFVQMCQNPTEEFFLVTFGSPRLGDDEFMNWFAQRFKGQFRHFANPCDPVVYLPPSTELVKTVLRRPSPLGSVLLLVYGVFWIPYTLLYGLGSGHKWLEHMCWIGQRGGLSPTAHRLCTYRSRLGL